MIKPENVTFPITAGDLIVLQRKELGREITPTEAEFFALVADMANEAYGAACAGDADTVQRLLDTVNAMNLSDKAEMHLAALCRGWILLGCQKGMAKLWPGGPLPS